MNKYYMYSNGFSYWGICIPIKGEVPREVSKEMHQLKHPAKGKWIW